MKELNKVAFLTAPPSINIHPTISASLHSPLLSAPSPSSDLRNSFKLTSAMAKFLAFFLFTLLAISILLQPTLLHASKGGHHSNNQKHNNHYGPGSLKSYQCPSQCSRRCGKTQYHKPCMFFCQKCCRKCLCVPPGYYGNKAVCPCYNNWKTKEGGPKCP